MDYDANQERFPSTIDFQASLHWMRAATLVAWPARVFSVVQVTGAAAPVASAQAAAAARVLT